MSFLNSVLKVFVGDKSKQDVKALSPIIEQVKAFEKELEALSHDGLREKTVYFKTKIAEARKEIEDKKSKLLEEAEATEDIDKREDIYQEIDKLEDQSYKITEGVLNEIMAEAFAVVKETTRRFKDNETITVTANAFAKTRRRLQA